MLQPKPHVAGLPDVSHGGIDYAELKLLGIKPKDILDFSVCTNPFGPPPGLAEELSQAAIERYPDSESSELKSRLAAKLKIPALHLLVGSGSTELIRLIALAYFGTGDSILIPQPTYGDYELACNLVGANVIKIAGSEAQGFNWNSAGLAEAIARESPKGIFLCNPNNPTGQYLSRPDIEKILTASHDTLLVLDEAYIDFIDGTWRSTDLVESGNLIILRSMTKDFALAGLRLGYAIANDSVIAILEKVKPPWNVNAAAQLAGLFALNNGNYLADCLSRIRTAGIFLINGLKGLGFKPLASQSHFFLLKVGNAAGLRRELLKKGILVRDCTSFGLPEYIRLSPRSIQDCAKLLEELGGILKNHP